MAPRLSERLAAKENDDIQKAMAASAASQPQTFSDSTATIKQSYIPDAAEESPQTLVGNVVTDPAEIVNDGGHENLQPRRANPKRRAAIMLAGGYALGKEVKRDETKATVSLETTFQNSTTRKRRVVSKRVAQHTEEQTSSAEVQSVVQEAPTTLDKIQELPIAGEVINTCHSSILTDSAPVGRSKKAIKQTKITGAKLENDFLTVEVVDNDENDEDFNPGSRSSALKAENSAPKQYSLRRTRGSGLLVEVCRIFV